MHSPAMLFESVVDIRDVLESFLVDGVLIADWQATLGTAAARLLALGTEWSDGAVLELGRATERLAVGGLRVEATLVRTAADDAARMLDEEARVPGFRRPEDEDWSF